MTATAGLVEVDRLNEAGKPVQEFVTGAGVDLTIGFDIERVGPGGGEELASPIIGHACLQAVLVIERYGIGAVAQPGQSELGDAGRLRVVEVDVPVDDGVVEDDAEAAFPEAVLECEFPAIDLGGLIAVDGRRDLESNRIVLGQAEDVASDPTGAVNAGSVRRVGIVGEDVLSDVGGIGTGTECRGRRASARARCRIGQIERRQCRPVIAR